MSSTSTTPKRPPASTATGPSKRTPSNNTSNNNASSNSTSPAPSRSPSRMAADGNHTTAATGRGTTTTTSSLNRARSVRNGAGTPVSARAAVRKTGPNDINDDAKAELQAKLDEVQEKLREAERACEESQKQAAVLQVRLDEAVRDQGRLEESAHEQAERVEELENERRESVRARRELEQIYEAERAQMMREKEVAEGQQEEMQNAMSRLKETLAQREMRERTTGLEDERRPSSVSRNGSFRSGNVSPNTDAGQFAPPSSVQRSDSRSSSRLVMQKDKIIEGLRLELAEAQIKLVELENQGGGRAHELQKEIYEVKMQNARLMEDNESFQLLLSEKTLNGDLAQSELLRPPSRSPHQGASLADELEGQQDDADHPDGLEPPDRRSQAEVNSLKDQNKALTLYINNIISRLLQHEQFEQILDKTPDLMAGPGALSRKFASVDTEKDLPAPPPKDEGSAASGEHQQQQPQQEGGLANGLLQRARSVMGGRPKPRPSSVYQPTSQPETSEPRMNENPDTAPSIPLGRSASTRGHRRAISDWPAASVVNNMMYRGPSPASQGPTSPGLSSPTLTGRNSFFGPGAMGGRVTSGGSTASGAIPSITEQEPSPKDPLPQNKENVPFPSSSAAPIQSTSHHRQRPSTDSISFPDNGAGGSDETLDGPPAPLPSSSAAASTASPPRSTTSSSGDRDRGENRSGAIMMGSKPRPLRLVQEAAGSDEADKARKNANRGSWFGWMNKGVSAALPGGGSGTGTAATANAGGVEPTSAPAPAAGAGAGGPVAQ